MCDCKYPIVAVTADVYVSGRLKKNGCYAVDRWLDCLFCGPHAERVDILAPPQKNPDTWTNHRPTRLFRPVYSESSLGQLFCRKNMKLKDRP